MSRAILVLFFIVLFFPLSVFAQDNPEQQVKGLLEAIGAGKWGVAVGFAIVLLTQLAKWFVGIAGKEIPKDVQPWIAASIGMLSGIGLGLSVGAVWYEALLAGLLTGSAAAGFWSLVVKHFRKGGAK
jgi:hypothetical protein